MSTSAHYPTSLSDEQWSVLQLMLPDSSGNPEDPDGYSSIFGGFSLACSMSIKPVVSGA